MVKLCETCRWQTDGDSDRCDECVDCGTAYTMWEPLCFRSAGLLNGAVSAVPPWEEIYSVVEARNNRLAKERMKAALSDKASLVDGMLDLIRKYGGNADG